MASMWRLSSGPGSMTATSSMPTRYVLVPGPVRGPGFRATMRRTSGERALGTPGVMSGTTPKFTCGNRASGPRVLSLQRPDSSDRGAAREQFAALALGAAAPYPVRFANAERLVEALRLDGAAGADRLGLGLPGGPPVGQFDAARRKEERCGRPPTQGQPLPVRAYVQRHAPSPRPWCMATAASGTTLRPSRLRTRRTYIRA